MPSLETLERRMARLLKKGTRRSAPNRVAARKRKNAYAYPPKWRDEICAEQGWKCTYCRRSMGREGRCAPERVATLDHIVPVSGGGRMRRSNLTAACQRCNSAKGSMSATEFREKLARDSDGSPQGGDACGSVHDSAAIAHNTPERTI